MSNTLRGIIGLVVVAILLGGGTLIVRSCNSSEKTPPAASATPSESETLAKQIAERRTQIAERLKAERLRKELEKAEKELASIEGSSPTPAPAPAPAPAVEAPAKVVTAKVATRPAQTAPAPANPQVINITMRQAQSQAQSGPGQSQEQGEQGEGCEVEEGVSYPTGQAKPVSPAVLQGLLQDLAEVRTRILQQKEVVRKARVSLENSRQSLRGPLLSDGGVRAYRQADVERSEDRLASENLKLSQLQEQEAQLRAEIKKAGGQN